MVIVETEVYIRILVILASLTLFIKVNLLP